LKLVVEVDGGYHLKNDQKEYDKYRADDLSDLGITIIRFTNSQVENDTVSNHLPHPQPLKGSPFVPVNQILQNLRADSPNPEIVLPLVWMVFPLQGAWG